MRQARAGAILVLTAAAALAGASFVALRIRGRRGSSLAVWYCRCLCALFRIRIAIENPTPLASPALIVCNHVSWTDVIVLGALKKLCFVAKKEVGSWPIAGVLAKSHGCIFVDRNRRMHIPKVNRQIARALACGDSVVLFAEATTGDGTRIRPFKSSLFAAAEAALLLDPKLNRILVQPASIVYKRRDGMPLGRNGRAAAAWYGDAGFLPSLRDLLRNGPLECEISFGNPIEVVQGSNRKAISKATELSVRALAAGSIAGCVQAKALMLDAVLFPGLRRAHSEAVRPLRICARERFANLSTKPDLKTSQR